MNFASSNPMQDLKGNQLVVGNISGDGSSMSEVINSLCLLHHWATRVQSPVSTWGSRITSACTGKKWVVFMDGIVVVFEPTAISEPAVALRAQNHGERNLKARVVFVEVDVPVFVETQRRMAMIREVLADGDFPKSLVVELGG